MGENSLLADILNKKIRYVIVYNVFSPVLSNIYMEFFERYLLPSTVNFELVWLRYVDDVFAVFT